MTWVVGADVTHPTRVTFRMDGHLVIREVRFPGPHPQGWLDLVSGQPLLVLLTSDAEFTAAESLRAAVLACDALVIGLALRSSGTGVGWIPQP